MCFRKGLMEAEATLLRKVSDKFVRNIPNIMVFLVAFQRYTFLDLQETSRSLRYHFLN